MSVVDIFALSKERGIIMNADDKGKLNGSDYDVEKEKVFWTKELASLAGGNSTIIVAICSYSGRNPKIVLTRQYEEGRKPIGWIAGYEMKALMPIFEEAIGVLQGIEKQLHDDMDNYVADIADIDSFEATPKKSRSKKPLSGVGKRKNK
jgi:hypothetical protein